MIVPTITMGLFGFAGLMRLMRASTLDVMSQDFIRTAYAKGLTRFAVDSRHVLKNALIPIVTVLTLSLDGMLTTSFVAERILGIPGMGNFVIESVFNRDYPVIMAVTPQNVFAISPAAHGDTPGDHTDTPGDHTDTPDDHSDTPATSHSDTPHIDKILHSDVSGGHFDSGFPHSDSPSKHDDSHDDSFFGRGHNDSRVQHTDVSGTPHSDGDLFHSDTRPHIDSQHSDIPGNSHLDTGSPHDDTTAPHADA